MLGSVGLKVLVLRGEMLPHSKRTTKLKAMAAVDQPTKKGVAVLLGFINPAHHKELSQIRSIWYRYHLLECPLVFLYQALRMSQYSNHSPIRAG